MHDDAPAALPLIAFAAGLACAPHLVNPFLAITGLVVLTRWWRASIFIALGIVIGLIAQSRTNDEKNAFESFGGFVTIEAPLEREWSMRGHGFVLSATHFRANGQEFDAPIAIYARFRPRRYDSEATVVAEGFLRRNEHEHYTLSVKSPRLLVYRGVVSPWWPSTWNRRIAQRLAPYAATHPHEIAMIEALALGRGERLDDETRTEYRRGGTYHLLVFSGLQIALAATVIALLLRWSGLPRVSDYSLLAFALIAPPFIGSTASVARASLGIGLYAVSRIAGRPTSFENLWCIAALLRLIVVPADLTDPAFHLTYAGAGALIFVGKALATWRLRWLVYAIAAELAVVPLTLFHFHQYAVGGSIATVAMTPIVFLQLVAGCAFAAMRAIFLLDVIRVLNAVAGWLNALASPASGFFAAPPAIALIAAYGASMLAIACSRGRRRALAIAALMILANGSAIARHMRARTVEEPTITFLDVGQGDSILIRSGRHAALIDGGGRSDDARFGEGTLLPLLVDRGVRDFDFVALTHTHPDHCGGLPAAIRELRTKAVILPPHRFRGECASAMLAIPAAYQFLREPLHLTLGNFSVTLLPPARRYRRDTENNSSIVAIVRSANRSALLTGDIEREAELDVADSIHEPIDVLKVPHHGSRSSTSRVLLDAVRPRLAVISCGRNNVFGHPHPQVLQSLTSRGIHVRRTDLNGSIDVTMDRVIRVTAQIDTPR